MTTILVTRASICVDPATHEIYTVDWRRRHRVPEPIVGLLAHLPPEGDVWPADQREAFLRALGGVLGFCYEDGPKDGLAGD